MAQYHGSIQMAKSLDAGSLFALTHRSLQASEHHRRFLGKSRDLAQVASVVFGLEA